MKLSLDKNPFDEILIETIKRVCISQTLMLWCWPNERSNSYLTFCERILCWLKIISISPLWYLSLLFDDLQYVQYGQTKSEQKIQVFVGYDKWYPMILGHTFNTECRLGNTFYNNRKLDFTGFPDGIYQKFISFQVDGDQDLDS